VLNRAEIKMTERDREVLELLVNESMSNKEIGSALGISELTVKQHLRNLYARLGFKEGRKRVMLAAMFRPVQESQPTNATFTNKEWRIASMVAEGLRNDVIGQRVGTSAQTIKNHLRAIFNKAGVWTRLELAAWVDAHRQAEAHGR
jgi:DNA-binding NarL/FixJ family response regulator